MPLWWRQHPNGCYALFVRSGLKAIEFEKGKSANCGAIGKCLYADPLQPTLRDHQLVLRHDILLHRLGVDDGFKTIIASPTAPKMTILLRTPIFGPFGGNQLVAAMDARHPEFGTPMGQYRRHGSLPRSPPLREEVTEL